MLPSHQGTSLVHTVDTRMSKYTKREIEDAKAARELFIRMGRPSEKDFMRLISSGAVRDSGVTTKAVEIAHDVFGKDIGTLMGRTIHGKVPRVDVPRVLPQSEEYKSLAMCIDIMEIPSSITRHVFPSLDHETTQAHDGQEHGQSSTRRSSCGTPRNDCGVRASWYDSDDNPQ